MSEPITADGLREAISRMKREAGVDFFGLPVIASDKFPYRSLKTGAWIHLVLVERTIYASPTLCQLLRGALTFESAILVAEELANMDEPCQTT
jgi:hypothetical protein